MGYTFNAPLLLRQALTHSSYTYEEKKDVLKANERLEFLGDAVLELCVSELLYTRFPKLPEGKLTQRRAGLVCEPCLAGIAREQEIGKYLLLGVGADQTGERDRGSILSDAMEALFGAVYLDGGLAAARAMIFRLYEPIVDKVLPLSRDYKTTLQEILQKNSRETAKYTIISENGPSHMKEFVAEVSHQGRVIGTGTGHSKKDAEQNAAMAALKV